MGRIITMEMGAGLQGVKPNFSRLLYFAAIGGLITIIPAFWAPFYFSYLAFGAGMGGVCFLFQWLAVGRRINSSDVIFLIAIILCVVLEVGSRWFLPSGIAQSATALCKIQSLGVFVFTATMLKIVFRKQLERDYAKAWAKFPRSENGGC